MAETLVACPKCNGTRRMPCPPSKYKRVMATYDPVDDTLACTNCGGHYMGMQASGVVPIDPATGLGCLHRYNSVKAGNCYYVHTCVKCGDRYVIDSSD